MTIQKLASDIAKREGKKSEARIGDIREILKIICTLDAESLLANKDQDGPLACLAYFSDKIADKLFKEQKDEVE